MLACKKKNLYFIGSTSGNQHITYTLFLNALSKFVRCRFALFNVSNAFEPASSKAPCVMEEGCAVILRSLVTR